jgi:hypothetical protein
MESSSTLSTTIGARRLARIVVGYRKRGAPTLDYTLAEIGPWDLAISRAVARVDVGEDHPDGGLLQRYGSSPDNQIGHLDVWLSNRHSESIGRFSL